MRKPNKKADDRQQQDDDCKNDQWLFATGLFGRVLIVVFFLRVFAVLAFVGIALSMVARLIAVAVIVRLNWFIGVILLKRHKRLSWNNLAEKAAIGLDTV